MVLNKSKKNKYDKILAEGLVSDEFTIKKNKLTKAEKVELKSYSILTKLQKKKYVRN